VLTSERSVQLDLLRAVAILLVVTGHAVLKIAKPDGIAGSIAGILGDFSYFGVPLFFTLSGYLVGGLLISEFRRRGKIDIKRFLIRRGLKIYPAYFALLAYLVIMPALKGTVPLSTLVDEYWANVFFLQNYVGSNPAGYTWSLAVEEHFYLTLPLILLAFVRLRLMPWLSTLCLLAPIAGIAVRTISAAVGDPYIHNFPSTTAATHLCLDGLIVGVGVRAFADFSADSFARLRVWRWPLLIVGIAILAAAALPMPTLLGVDLNRILPINTLSATALLVGVLHFRLPGWSSRGIALIGKYSYGIYLWHATIIGFVARTVVSRLPGEGGSLNWVIAETALTMASVLFGIFMSRLVEVPVLALRDRFFPSRGSRGISCYLLRSMNNREARISANRVLE
jgi:peptidoglycan/LPS O-acetylase OafA/YrhL